MLISQYRHTPWSLHISVLVCKCIRYDTKYVLWFKVYVPHKMIRKCTILHSATHSITVALHMTACVHGYEYLYMCVWCQKQPEQNNLSKIRIHVFKINTFVFLVWSLIFMMNLMWHTYTQCRAAHSFIHWPWWLVVWFIYLVDTCMSSSIQLS